MSLEKIINGIKKAAYITVATMALASGTTSGMNPKYTIERISVQDPNATLTEAHGINDDGEVVGLYGWVGRSPCYMGFFIYKHGMIREIKLDEDYAFFNPYPYGPGGTKLGANPPRPKINNFGDVLLGNVVYKRNNDKLVLNLLVSPFCYYGKDLNDNCDVVASGSGQAYLYSEGEVIELGFWSHHFAINNNKQIVGEYFLWENGVKTRLKAPDIKSVAYPWDINNNGTIVGYFGLPASGAAIWKDDELIRFGTRCTWAMAINDKEQIVGSYAFDCGGRETAFLFEDGRKTDLNKLLPENSGWEHLIRALDINYSGQIVGYGNFSDEDGIKRQAFLMTPIPLEGDLNEDDVVNFEDLAILANHWLEEK